MGELAEEGIVEADLELLLSCEMQLRARSPGTHALIVNRKKRLLTVVDVIDITAVNMSHDDVLAIYSRILPDGKGYLVTGHDSNDEIPLHFAYEERSQGAQKLLGYACIDKGTWHPILHASWGVTYGKEKIMWHTFAGKNGATTQHRYHQSPLLPAEY